MASKTKLQEVVAEMQVAGLVEQADEVTAAAQDDQEAIRGLAGYSALVKAVVVGAHPAMNAEDKLRIQQIDREIARLGTEGDDYYVRQDQKKLREEKSRILERNRTPEQKEALRQSQQKQGEKRWAERHARDAKEKTRLAGLTERQIAINKLCDLKYRLTIYDDSSYHRGPSRISIAIKERNKIRKQMDEIKKQFNIKSSEIKRQ